MSMPKQKRLLGELKMRASQVLELEGEFRKKLINIAATKNPASVYGLAQATSVNHGHTFTEADELARAARWLAIIRRDYGEQKFKKVIS
ncbi:MAG: hypothetical protein ABIG40_00735 [Parcubacteria group bacterium]